jgi:hypothetical protein
MGKGVISRVEILRRYLEELQKLNEEYLALSEKYKGGFKSVSDAVDCLEAIYELRVRELVIEFQFRHFKDF